MKKLRKQAITCTGDNYKVQQLRLALEGMDLSKHSDDWDIAQVRSSYMKGINLDKGAINLLIDYYTNTYDPTKDEFSSDYVGSACNRRKAVKANNRPAPRRRTINAANERNDLVITKINDYSTWPNDKRPFDIPVIGYGKDEFEADGTHYVAYYDKETHTYSSVEKVPDYHRVEARYRIKNPNENIKLEDIKEYFSTKSVDAACGKKRNIKAALYDNAYEDIEISRDAYIQQWQDEYEGEPSTSWDHIFDMILDDFVLYCGDEASTDETGKTIEEKYESGEYTSADVEDEFDNWIMWISLDDYDYE